MGTIDFQFFALGSRSADFAFCVILLGVKGVFTVKAKRAAGL
jgi:hypothetical protein